MSDESNSNNNKGIYLNMSFLEKKWEIFYSIRYIAQEIHWFKIGLEIDIAVLSETPKTFGKIAPLRWTVLAWVESWASHRKF